MLSECLTWDDVQIVPRYSEILSRSDCSTASRFTRNYMIEVPIIASPMDSVCELDMALVLWRLGAVGILHRFTTIENQSQWAKLLWDAIQIESIVPGSFPPVIKKSGRFQKPVIAAAIGATGDYLERATELLKNKVNVLCIDVAHGHHIHVKNAILKLLPLKFKYEFDIIAGNVATSEGAADLENWGADCVRVGLGGGSVCETRIRTGVGVPQLSAVLQARENVHVPVISDGGIRFIGDISKAICAGADTVMIGSLFSGTDEAPGNVVVSGMWPNVQMHKLYRGSSSESMKISNGSERSHVEGTSKMVPLKGPVSTIVKDITDGLKSTMSYLGVDNILEMQSAASFIKITPAGMIEALPHLL